MTSLAAFLEPSWTGFIYLFSMFPGWRLSEGCREALVGHLGLPCTPFLQFNFHPWCYGVGSGPCCPPPCSCGLGVGYLAIFVSLSGQVGALGGPASLQGWSHPYEQGTRWERILMAAQRRWLEEIIREFQEIWPLGRWDRLSRQSPGCHRSRYSQKSRDLPRVPPRDRMDLTSLQKQSPSGGFGDSQNSLCPPPPAQDPHQDVRRGLQGAPPPVHSRTTPLRRCWSCRWDRDLTEPQVPRAGRALGRALLGDLGGAGRNRVTDWHFPPCSHSMGSHFLIEVEPIPVPIFGVALSQLPSLLLSLGSLNPSFPPHSLCIPFSHPWGLPMPAPTLPTCGIASVCWVPLGAMGRGRNAAIPIGLHG